MEYKKRPDLYWNNWISVPFILMVLPSLILLDIFIELYQNICFRLYKIKLIKRGDYIRIDRQKLKYLSLFEKFGCSYCGYANGLLQYASAIANRTEKYWCGIKHKKSGEDDTFKEPPHHKDFLEYGDEEGYKKLK